MKNLFTVFSCLIVAAATAIAQQGGEPKLRPPALQPSGDMLVKALLAADNAQSKKEPSSAEDLKNLLEREIAKSAALPLATTTQTPVEQGMKAGETFTFTVKGGMVVIDGAVYLRFGDAIYPMVGGGASGCFDPNTDAKVQKARMKFTEQLKTEQEKKD
ncbi:MAG: hypothetical protein ABIP14_05865 [Blastocatellia bacterium]